MGGMLAYKEITHADFQKYDTAVSTRLSYYIFFQFVILLLGTSAFLFGMKNLDSTQIAVVSVFIIYSVVSIGGLFEKRKWVAIAEILRVLLLTFVIAVIIMKFYPLAYAISGAGVYLLMSFVWFATIFKELNQNNQP
jgi:hypothetical protein